MAKSKRYNQLGFAPSNSTDTAALRAVTTIAAVGGGAALGAAVGKPSLLLGLALVGAGAYFDKPQVIAAGAGMAFVPTTINAARAAELGGKQPTMIQAATARVKSLLDTTKSNANPFKKDGGVAGFGMLRPTDYYAGAPGPGPYTLPLTNYTDANYAAFRGIGDGSPDMTDLNGLDATDLSGTDTAASVLM